MLAGSSCSQAQNPETVERLNLVAFEVDHGWAGTPEEFAITCAEVDGDAAEGLAPFDAASIEVRMADGDRRQSSQAPDPVLGRGVDKGEAVPQEVALGSGQQECPLPDPHRGLGGDLPEAGFQLAELGPKVALHLCQARPPLALAADVLALVGADRTAFWRNCGWSLLYPAGLAYESGHRVHDSAALRE